MVCDSLQEPPYFISDYDWLGRVTASASFATEPTWSAAVTNANYAANTTTSRKTLSKNLFDSQGRMYRQEVYQITSSGTAGTAMTVNHYYDPLGRQVASQQTGGLGTATTYDALGRGGTTYPLKPITVPAPQHGLTPLCRHDRRAH
ncbi:MAG: hypothetical protein LBJ67_03720 [Planctomycetaceae bacterium]|jgi:hypothetical protein|nr:hypothetical protein [Planctomycetaceae bacterium]